MDTLRQHTLVSCEWTRHLRTLVKLNWQDPQPAQVLYETYRRTIMGYLTALPVTGNLEAFTMAFVDVLFTHLLVSVEDYLSLMYVLYVLCCGGCDNYKGVVVASLVETFCDRMGCV